MFSHSYAPADFEGFDGSEFRLLNVPARRLVVFIHGWGGSAIKTWGTFPDPEVGRDWWSDSDLLFLGYKSTMRDPLGVADVLRGVLDGIYPDLPSRFETCLEAAVREPGATHYKELVLVGHSLGGVIVRQVVVDMVNESLASGRPAAPQLEDAVVRLFAPATGGFAPSGVGGLLYGSALPASWKRHISVVSRSFAMLQPGSAELQDLQHNTEYHAEAYPGTRALRAAVLWAGRDRVVHNSRYATPPMPLPFTQLDAGHKEIAKPRDHADKQWVFVESGEYSPVP